VGHRIIEINGHSVVATSHERIVSMLANSTGEVSRIVLDTKHNLYILASNENYADSNVSFINRTRNSDIYLKSLSHYSISTYLLLLFHSKSLCDVRESNIIKFLFLFFLLFLNICRDNEMCEQCFYVTSHFFCI
jgi:hypothetical protein